MRIRLLHTTTCEFEKSPPPRVANSMLALQAEFGVLLGHRHCLRGVGLQPAQASKRLAAMRDKRRCGAAAVTVWPGGRARSTAPRNYPVSNVWLLACRGSSLVWVGLFLVSCCADLFGEQNLSLLFMRLCHLGEQRAGGRGELRGLQRHLRAACHEYQQD